MASLNYYELLGIRRDHPQQMIPQAFRTRIKEVHPDKYQMSDHLNQNKENAIKVFQAYKILNDPQLRRQYDKKLEVQQQIQAASLCRHFEATNLIKQGGKWMTECQQCMGKTEINQQQLNELLKQSNNFLMRCFHCGLALQIQIQHFQQN